VRAGLGVAIENADVTKTSFHVSSVLASGVAVNLDLESNNSINGTQLHDIGTIDIQ